MPVSVEARAIRATDRLCDLHIASVHLPEGADNEPLQYLVARLLGIPGPWVITQEELQAFLRDMPPQLTRGGNWQWDGSAKALLDRYITCAAHGNFSAAVSPTEWDAFPPFIHPGHWEDLWMYRRRTPNLGLARSPLALDVAVRLSGTLGQDESLAADVESLLAYEVPTSKSPGVKGFSLRAIADNARYIVLLPLAAGAVQTVNAVSRGEWTAAVYTALASGGSTLVFVGTLWLADKLFGGVKHLDAAPDRRQLPGSAANVTSDSPRRKLPKGDAE